MPEAGLEKENKAHTILVENFKHREDLKMYGGLPDYEEFQGFYLRIDSELSQIDEAIYANFHKPSWRGLNRHLFLSGITTKLLRHLKILSVDDTKDEFKQERMFGRVEKSRLQTRLTIW